MAAKKYQKQMDQMEKQFEQFPETLMSKDNTMMCDLFEGDGLPEIKRRPVNLQLAHVRQTKRLMREVLSDVLHIENEQGDSNLELIMDALVSKAACGDLKAIELVAKIMNEVSDQKVEVSMPAISIHVDGDNSGIRFSEDPDQIK